MERGVRRGNFEAVSSGGPTEFRPSEDELGKRPGRTISPRDLSDGDSGDRLGPATDNE